MRQPLGDDVVPARQIAAIRRLCKDLNTQTVEFTTEALLDDFAASLLAPCKGTSSPVHVKLGTIKAELEIVWIGDGRAWGVPNSKYVDFLARVCFRDGSDSYVGGRYFHWPDRPPAGESRGGFVYHAYGDNVNPLQQFLAAQRKS